ncbi:MAG TPA: serine dehydratase beta chain, partial [Dermatophilaceae bacterium]
MSKRTIQVPRATVAGPTTAGQGEERPASVSVYCSALDFFSIGIGPSSSHTVGPMRAALAFAGHLEVTGLLTSVTQIRCSLYGSLGATGLGHGTPDAVLAGLAGFRPETCDPGDVRGAWSALPTEGATIALAGTHQIPISKDDVSLVPRTRLPGHPNALTLSAWGQTDALPLLEETYYSVGGGFIRQNGEPVQTATRLPQPLPFSSGEELLALCDSHGIDICDVARANEESIHGSEKLDAGLDAIWAAMCACVDAGLYGEGTLPGGLGVKRRASAMRLKLEEHGRRTDPRHDTTFEWLQTFALAVNEENASGGR